MLLRLTPGEALGRAAFAAAAVGAAFTGHVAVGHEHCDLAQVIAATLGLIFVSWRTRSIARILAAAIIAQVVVHGGIPTQPHMLLIHAVAASLALALMHRGEDVWRALRSLRAPRPLRLLAVPALPNMRVVIVSSEAWPPRRPGTAALLRAPPAFA